MLIARPGTVPRMIGRQEQVGVLRRLLPDGRRQGHPEVALVTGEAGVGKTRLLRQLVDEIGGGCRVLASQAREGDASRGFALVRDALEEHLGRDGQLPAGLARWRHPLGHLLSPLVSLDDHPEDGHVHAEEELVRAAVALVDHLVGDGPALVVFEDLQWADGESLEVLGRLARSDLPVLLVGSFRPEDFDRRRPLAGLLAHLERDHPVTHVSIDRLGRSELAEFLEAVCGRPVSGEVVDRLHRRTGGNPFFVEELLATAGQRAVGNRDGALAPDTLAEAALPWSTREAVLRRLDTFDAAVRDVLAAASVLGERFDLGLLSGVSHTDPEELASMLAGLVHSGVLVEHGSDAFAFRHVLVREAITGELLARDRRAIHERALRWLIDDGDGDPERAAYHAAEAGRADEAAEYARRAAGQGLHSAPRNALRLASRALTHFEGDLVLHRLASRAAAKIGELDAAVDHARAWAEAARAEADRAETARASCQLAWSLWISAEPERAWEAIEQTTEIADELEPADQAEVAATQALLLGDRGQAEEAVDKADQAIALAERAGDRRTRAMAFVTKSVALVDSPAHQEPEAQAGAAALLRRARADSAAVGDIENEARALHSMLLPDQAVALSLAESLELLRQGREHADRYGLERFAGKLTVLELYVHLRAGNMAQASDAVVAARRANVTAKEAIWRERLAGHLATASGDLDAARTALASQRQVLADRDNPEARLDLLCLEAEIAGRVGDHETAAAALQLAGEQVPRVCPCAASDWWEIAVAAIDAGVAPANVRHSFDTQAPSPMPRHAGLVAYATGCLLAAEGHDELAVEQLSRSVGEPRGGRRVALFADGHRRLAAVSARRGDRAAARHHIEAGLALLYDWPGAPRPELEALSRRIGDPDRSPHALLTGREHEVLRVLAQGCSNSEIAERLFITRKTVATHVSNILSKTGFSSRTQVASWAIQEGLVSGHD